MRHLLIQPDSAITDKERITIRLDRDLVQWFRQKVHDVVGGN